MPVITQDSRRKFLSYRAVAKSPKLNNDVSFWSDQIEFPELRTIFSQRKHFIPPYTLLSRYYDFYFQGYDFSSILERAESNLEHSVLLDIGCGTGAITANYSNLVERTIGIDPSAEMIERAIKTFESQDPDRARSLEFRCVHEFELVQSFGNCFDFVTCGSDALNYLMTPVDLTQKFRNVSRLLKDDGCFIFDAIESATAILHFSKVFHVDVSNRIGHRARFAMVAEPGRCELSANVYCIFGEGIELHKRRAFPMEEIEQAVHRADMKLDETFTADRTNTRFGYVASRQN